MIDAPEPNPETAEDAWLDRLLREDAHAAPPIADSGFTSRVMRTLPCRRRSAAWLVPMFAALGAVLGLYAFGGAEFFFDALLDMATGHEFGANQFSLIATLTALYASALSGAWSER